MNEETLRASSPELPGFSSGPTPAGGIGPRRGVFLRSVFQTGGDEKSALSSKINTLLGVCSIFFQMRALGDSSQERKSRRKGAEKSARTEQGGVKTR
jgi:hypothetical protein